MTVTIMRTTEAQKKAAEAAKAAEAEAIKAEAKAKAEKAEAKKAEAAQNAAEAAEARKADTEAKAKAEAEAKAKREAKAEAEAQKILDTKAAEVIEAVKAAETLRAIQLEAAQRRETLRDALRKAEAEAEAEALSQMDEVEKAAYLIAKAKAEAEAEARDKAHTAYVTSQWAKEKRTKEKDKESLRKPTEAPKVAEVVQAIRNNAGFLKVIFSYRAFRFRITDCGVNDKGDIFIAFKFAKPAKSKDGTKDGGYTYSEKSDATYHYAFRVDKETYKNERGQSVTKAFRVIHVEQIHKNEYITEVESGTFSARSALIKLAKLEADKRELNKSNTEKRKFYLGLFGTDTIAEALTILESEISEAAKAEAAEVATVREAAEAAEA